MSGLNEINLQLYTAIYLQEKDKSTTIGSINSNFDSFMAIARKATDNDLSVFVSLTI